ncbi:hypothetical protein D3C73_1377350 [compost metagenome]
MGVVFQFEALEDHGITEAGNFVKKMVKYEYEEGGVGNDKRRTYRTAECMA